MLLKKNIIFKGHLQKLDLVYSMLPVAMTAPAEPHARFLEQVSMLQERAGPTTSRLVSGRLPESLP